VTATPEAVVRRLVELMPAGRAEEVGNLLDPDVVWLGSRGGLDANRVVRGIDASWTV